MESGVGVEKDYRNQQPDNGSVLYGAEGSIQASKGRDEQQRWSAKGKMEVVLRILRGEPVDGLSRELRVAVPDLVRWRDDFLARGLANLKARPAGPTEEQLRQAQAKIGDLAMRLELGRRAHPKRGLCWQAEAVWAMSREASLSTNKRYPLGMVCQVWRFSKATCYRHQGVEAPLAGQEEEKAKRGPKPAISDEELLEAIRQVLAEAPFYGEGYRKVTARLRFRGLGVGKNRVLRLMRLHGLLAPVKWVHEHGDEAHKGTILTDEPERMWGTDAARFWTEQDGWCWWFGVIDHCVEDVVGWHVAKIGDRFAALEPIRQGVREHFGGFDSNVARGLAIRHDWGSQYTSAAFVGEPECNGLIERFVRTLKEQCLYVHRFETLEQARQVIGEFIARYNQEWIIGKLGYRTPMEVRARYTKQAA